MSFRRCLSGGGDIFSKSVERQGGANRTFATGSSCHEWQLEPCPQFINVSQRALHIYWQFSAMSHAIHKIVSKKRCQSYFISRRSPHHGISKDSDLCASAHRCPHYAYARLIARVNSQFVSVVHSSLQKFPEIIQSTYQVP